MDSIISINNVNVTVALTRESPTQDPSGAITPPCNSLQEISISVQVKCHVDKNSVGQNGQTSPQAWNATVLAAAETGALQNARTEWQSLAAKYIALIQCNGVQCNRLFQTTYPDDPMITSRIDNLLTALTNWGSYAEYTATCSGTLYYGCTGDKAGWGRLNAEAVRRAEERVAPTIEGAGGAGGGGAAVGGAGASGKAAPSGENPKAGGKRVLLPPGSVRVSGAKLAEMMRVMASFIEDVENE